MMCCWNCIVCVVCLTFWVCPYPTHLDELSMCDNTDALRARNGFSSCMLVYTTRVLLSCSLLPWSTTLPKKEKSGLTSNWGRDPSRSAIYGCSYVFSCFSLTRKFRRTCMPEETNTRPITRGCSFGIHWTRRTAGVHILHVTRYFYWLRCEGDVDRKRNGFHYTLQVWQHLGLRLTWISYKQANFVLLSLLFCVF